MAVVSWLGLLDCLGITAGSAGVGVVPDEAVLAGVLDEDAMSDVAIPEGVDEGLVGRVVADEPAPMFLGSGSSDEFFLVAPDLVAAISASGAVPTGEMDLITRLTELSLGTAAGVLRHEALGALIEAFEGIHNTSDKTFLRRASAAKGLVRVLCESDDEEVFKRATHALLAGINDDVVREICPVLTDIAIHDPRPWRAKGAITTLATCAGSMSTLGSAALALVSSTTAAILRQASEERARLMGDTVVQHEVIRKSPRSAACAAYAFACALKEATRSGLDETRIPLCFDGLAYLLSEETWFVLRTTSDALAWLAVNGSMASVRSAAIQCLRASVLLDHHRSLYVTWALGHVTFNQVTVGLPLLVEESIRAGAFWRGLGLGLDHPDRKPYVPKRKAAPRRIRDQGWRALRDGMASPNILIACHAVYALRLVQPEQSVLVFGKLKELLTPGHPAPLQLEAVKVLRHLAMSDSPNISQPARAGLAATLIATDLQDEVAMLAAEGLGIAMTHSKNLDGIDALMTALADPRPLVAEAAALAWLDILSAIENRADGVIVQQGVAALMQAVHSHPSRRVYTAAGWVLGRVIADGIVPGVGAASTVALRDEGVERDERAHILAALHQTPPDLPTLCALYWPFMGVRLIQLFDGGNTFSERAYQIGPQITLPPQVPLIADPEQVSLPQSLSVGFASAPPNAGKPTQQIGRCEVSAAEGGGLWVVKFPRAERGSPDGPRREVWAQRMLVAIPGLESPVPEPVVNVAGELVLFYNPAARPDDDDPDATYNIIAFRTDAGYFRYLNGPDVTLEEFWRGLGRALHDTGLLARQGYYHTDIVPLRHNREGGAVFRTQGDSGTYRIAPDLLQGRLGRRGMGRLDDVGDSLTYPNVSVNGLRDLEHIFRAEEIFDEAMFFDDPVHEWRALRRQKNSHALLDAMVMGNVYFAAALLIAERMAREVALLSDPASCWRDDDWLLPWVDSLLTTFARGYAERWEISLQRAVDVLRPRVDWLRLARQLVFNMSGAYVPFVAPDARPEDFPIASIFGEGVVLHGFGPYREGSYYPETGYVGPDGDRGKKSLGPLNGPFVITELETAIFAVALAPGALNFQDAP